MLRTIPTRLTLLRPLLCRGQFTRFYSRPSPSPTSTTSSEIKSDFYSVIDKCPETTLASLCDCRIEYDQPIAHDKLLLNTTAAHAKHLLICTDESAVHDTILHSNSHNHSLATSISWPSKIELEPNSLAGALASIKQPSLANDHQNPFNTLYPIMITNVDLPNEASNVTHNKAQDMKKKDFRNQAEYFYSAYLYPDNIYFPRLSTLPAPVNQFVKSYLVPYSKRDHASRKNFPHTSKGAHNHYRNLILICGHAKRDSRCGLAAPVLFEAFQKVLMAKGLNKTMKVGICSHVGGHAYAGNVICFDNDGNSVWYGRVEPKHVEGIVEHTCEEKKIIKELYRGGIN